MTRRMVYGFGFWLTIACKFSSLQVEIEAKMLDGPVGSNGC